MRYFHNDDTIVALATAPGIGAIAVIRLSGPKAIEIADKLFTSKKGKQKSLTVVKSHTLHYGTITENGNLVDEVLISLMRSPNTYTGEDIVEVSCHGSVYIQQKIIQLCQSAGARLAGPGEFTMRAFLNGKMDLSQAEAVADLIAADSMTAHRLALKQMRGGFSEEIRLLREKLINFASLIELELDFAEEDVEFASREDLKKVIEQLQNVIAELLSSFELGNVIRKGIPVVIAGKPNAGKSTLLNALLNEERAIVSDIPGTTRDTIEEEITLEGVKFRFIDTAGLRETKDIIEQTGVSKAFEKMNESPVILYVFDVLISTARDLHEELYRLKESLYEGAKIIPVGNKIDTVSLGNLEHEFKPIKNIFFISAREKSNLDSLRSNLLSLYSHGKIDANNSIVTSVRHAEALRKTAGDLSNVYTGLSENKTSDFIAADLRQALMHLGEITGDITTEDLLENIFSRFCIGK
jgi:tRNA modification GTPase